MIKKTLLFFVEEPSAEEMLDELMQRIFQENKLSKEELDYKIIASNGKDGLEKRISGGMKGLQKAYPNPIAIVMYDNDSKDCKQEKGRWAQRINSKFAKVVTLNSKNKDPFPLYEQLPVVIRVACQELESFFLGDVEAVNQALGTKLNQVKGIYNKDPDAVEKPSAILEKDTIYTKGAHPREIAKHLDIKKTNIKNKNKIKNKSPSYKLLLATIHTLIAYRGTFNK